MKRWLHWLVLLVITMSSTLVTAHEVRPAYLQLTETGATRADVLWKQPQGGQMPGNFAPRLSPQLLDRTPDSVYLEDSFAVHQWRDVELGATGLDGREVSIDGLDRTITDTLLVVRFQDGREIQQLLTPARPAFVINAQRGAAVPAYLWLGIEHILSGLDHLLFVLGLMLLSSGLKRLVVTITAFTVAHSITLAANALHWMRVDSSFVEVLVALSIVYLAMELVRQQRSDAGLTARYPWLIAFVFGLLHGCAFAGALQEIGLPEHNLLLALLLFNAGVELGQIAFVITVGAAWLTLRRVGWTRTPQWVALAPAYIIGCLSVFWLLERLQVALA